MTISTQPNTSLQPCSLSRPAQEALLIGTASQIVGYQARERSKRLMRGPAIGLASLRVQARRAYP
jgi:hypothetical protein